MKNSYHLPTLILALLLGCPTSLAGEQALKQYIELAKGGKELCERKVLCDYYSKNYRELKPENMYLSYKPVTKKSLKELDASYQMERKIIEQCLKQKQACICIIFGNYLGRSRGGYLHLYINAQTGEIIGRVHYR